MTAIENDPSDPGIWRGLPLSRRQILHSAAVPLAGFGSTWLATACSSAEREAPLPVSAFREPGDGADWSPALNRAFARASQLRRNLEMPRASQPLLLAGAVDIAPDAGGMTPWLYGRGAGVRLANVGAGFRYRGRKDGMRENPLAGGMSDLVIDYRGIGDPAVNSGARGVYISNGGGSLTFERVRGVGMAFGYHIQNWRYADGGHPGGRLTTRDCDCSGVAADHAAPKWYPFGDQGDLSIGMPGDLVKPGQATVIATVEHQLASYAAFRPAQAVYWRNRTTRPVRIPDALTAAALTEAGLVRGPASASLHGTMLDAITHAYWSSGGRRSGDCVVRAEGGLIDGADHDGGYYGTMLSGVESYEVRDYRTRNNVRGIAGQHGARRVTLQGVRIARSQSSAILAGYDAPDWRIDDFEIEASNDRWIGEALMNFQLGAANTVVGRGSIRMGDDQKTGQYAVKFGPNSPGCRIDGPLTISGDCARAYIAVESAWDRSLSRANPENYAQHDYRGIASLAMEDIALTNITIAAKSVDQQVPTAIAVIQASDGDAAAGGHGMVPIVDLTIDNVAILSDKHRADVKLIRSVPARTAAAAWAPITLGRLQAGSAERPRPLRIIG